MADDKKMLCLPGNGRTRVCVCFVPNKNDPLMVLQRSGGNGWFNCLGPRRSNSMVDLSTNRKSDMARDSMMGAGLNMFKHVKKKTPDYLSISLVQVQS